MNAAEVPCLAVTGTQSGPAARRRWRSWPGSPGTVFHSHPPFAVDKTLYPPDPGGYRPTLKIPEGLWCVVPLSYVVTAMVSSSTGYHRQSDVTSRCLVRTRPMKHEHDAGTGDEQRGGKIRRDDEQADQMPTRMITSRNPFEILDHGLFAGLNCRLRYMNRASLAMSDVWKVMLITGNLISVFLRSVSPQPKCV